MKRKDAVLSETQIKILSAGAQRPGNIAMPLPEGLWGAAAKKSVEALLRQGLLQAVDADIRRGAPLWRETGDGHGTTLVVTEAGLFAIGIKPVVVQAKAVMREQATEAPAPKRPTPRGGTKQATLIALLEVPEGASLAEITAATGWQAHSARGAISGGLKKKLGLSVTSERVEGRGRVYRLR